MAYGHSEARCEDQLYLDRWSDRLRAAPCSKTSRTGFLHLPQHVRGRIYKLALYDHDRSVVFLPRALPRRVDYHWEGDLPDPLDLASSLPTTTEIGNNKLWEQYGANMPTTDDCSAGNWVKERGRDTDIRLSGSASCLTDYSAFSSTADRNVDLSEHDVLRSSPETSNSSQSDASAPCCASSDVVNTEDEGFVAQVRVMSEGEGCNRIDDEADTTSSLSGSDEGDRSETNSSAASPRSFESITSSSTNAPPSSCLDGECRDMECEHCAGHGLASNEDQSCYQNSEESSVSEHENDEEHFDPFEITGMLYEPKEPSILLACKEIRKQCLLQYYASNAFSWRFEWLNYKDSLSHFFGWVDHVVRDHTREMTGVSFQGRHVVEEGVDFDADIDILTSAPFFQVKVAATHNDEPLRAILDGLKRHLIAALWEKLQTNGSRVLMTEADLKELGEIFVCAMHR